MKDTIKNSIIRAFAIFGFITLTSSANNSSTVLNDQENKFNIVAGGGEGSGVYMLNMQTGETWWINGKNTKVKHK